MDRSGEQMTRDDIRIRIMQEALDCADRGETEAYNSIKVMCSEVLAMVEEVVKAEREACALVADEEFGSTLMIGDAQPKHSSAWRIAAAIRARGET
jgi:hypothetical protein